MSRFAIDPRWLIYLPPTMSPCETAKAPGYLEYPTESFGYYRHLGVARVVCEEKHMGLLAEQYLPTAEAGHAALTATQSALEQAIARELRSEALDLAALRAQASSSLAALARYQQTIAGYLWEVADIDKIAIAPFHLLATEGKTYFDRDHLWHLETLSALAEADTLFRRTKFRAVDVLDEQAMPAATEWWKELTGAGAEGMVVKPLSFIARGPNGLVQPALKCRGRDYLRIIYGPEYWREANLTRLRQRGLGKKRSLALREFGLGVESLERFVRKESLRRVHECVFALLALESEPVDPRL